MHKAKEMSSAPDTDTLRGNYKDVAALRNGGIWLKNAHSTIHANGNPLREDYSQYTRTTGFVQTRPDAFMEFEFLQVKLSA